MAYIRCYDGEDGWDIEDERPYTMTLAGNDMSRWDADCWAYCIASILGYDRDEYYDFLDDINNLRAYEWIDNGWLDGLDADTLSAFKAFVGHSGDDSNSITASSDCDSCMSPAEFARKYFSEDTQGISSIQDLYDYMDTHPDEEYWDYDITDFEFADDLYPTVIVEDMEGNVRVFETVPTPRDEW